MPARPSNDVFDESLITLRQRAGLVVSSDATLVSRGSPTGVA
jgi:hypothetical protein